ncbi:MAG TPA: hypothetical protein VFW50_12440 [Streptosporangiaceae bacterium]|nr:hypothetical protein [Streptosporangiaceae bacterium]
MKDGWWQRTPRRPGLVLAVATLAALAASAGITAIMTAGGGSHRPLAAGAGLGAGVPVPSAASRGPAGSDPASTGPSPSRSPAATAHPTPRAPASAGASSPSSLASPRGHRTPTAPPPTAPGSSSANPPPSSPPAQGYLLLAPDHLVLTSRPGQPASGFFVLTAANGPVAQYTVRLVAGAARVSVAPVSGSLALNGFVQVAVTVTSKTALTAQIVVEPGNLSVTVVYKPKPKPAPAPSPSPSHGKDGNGNGDG